MDGYQTKIRLVLVASKSLLSKIIKNCSLFSYLDMCAVMFSSAVCFTWTIVCACVCSAELFFQYSGLPTIVEYRLPMFTSCYFQTDSSGGGGGGGVVVLNMSQLISPGSDSGAFWTVSVNISFFSQNTHFEGIQNFRIMLRMNSR